MHAFCNFDCVRHDGKRQMAAIDVAFVMADIADYTLHSGPAWGRISE